MSTSVSNATSAALTVWIEPWCDELTLPPRSTLALCSGAGRCADSVADLEILDDRLVIWATSPGTLIVTIDGFVQDTGSRKIDLPPELVEVPVRTFVNIAFRHHPGARITGAPYLPWGKRLTRLCGRIKALLRP